MTCNLILVPQDKATEMWPAVLPLVAQMVQRSGGEITTDGALAAVTAGELQLWLIWDDETRRTVAGALTSIGVTGSGMRLCTVYGLVGEHRQQWLHLLEEFERWAILKGCHKVKVIARKGWAKELPDYTMTHVTLEKRLADVANEEAA